MRPLASGAWGPWGAQRRERNKSRETSWGVVGTVKVSDQYCLHAGLVPGVMLSPLGPEVWTIAPGSALPELPLQQHDDTSEHGVWDSPRRGQEAGPPRGCGCGSNRPAGTEKHVRSCSALRCEGLERRGLGNWRIWRRGEAGALQRAQSDGTREGRAARGRREGFPACEAKESGHVSSFSVFQVTRLSWRVPARLAEPAERIWGRQGDD